MKFLILLFGLSLSTYSCAQTPEHDQTVASVDLQKYQGTWYELASMPQFFQRKCVSDVKATYKLLPKDLVEVTNSCVLKDGAVKTAQGRAKIPDPKKPGQLKVTFVNVFDTWVYPFGGDYWIIDLAADYSYAVIGHPKKTYGWVLSRKTALDGAELKGIEGRLKEKGYDTCKFLTTVQKGGNFKERIPLCKIP